MNIETLTVRDYFAGQALAANRLAWDDTNDESLIAEKCYRIADEMIKIKEREDAINEERIINNLKKWDN